MSGRKHFEAMGRRAASYGLAYVQGARIFAPGLQHLPIYARAAFMRGWLEQGTYRG